MQLSRPDSSDPFLLVRPHVQRILWPPTTTPPVEDQVSKHRNLWETFHIQIIKDICRGCHYSIIVALSKCLSLLKHGLFYLDIKYRWSQLTIKGSWNNVIAFQNPSHCSIRATEFPFLHLQLIASAPFPSQHVLLPPVILTRANGGFLTTVAAL